MSKTVILAKHNDAQLANQLWVHISIYAYCLEKGYSFETYKFYEYAEFFNIQSKNFFINLIFYKGFPFIKNLLKPLNYFKKRLNFYTTRKLFKFVYLIFYMLLEIFQRDKFVYAGYIPNTIHDIYLLPPTKSSEYKLKQLEDDSNIKKIYFSGWLFRNPKGIKKFRKEILDYFKPKEKYLNRVENEISQLRNKYKNLIGVHLRQKENLFDGEWKYDSNAMFYFSEKDYSLVIRCFVELLKFKNYKKEETCFIICSNKYVDLTKFSDYNVVRYEKNNEAQDLWLLSKTDVLLGCQSSFSVLASALGDIPLILIQNPIDWDYYKDKDGYFQNKYFVQYFVF
jgi:hypothetical protein